MQAECPGPDGVWIMKTIMDPFIRVCHQISAARLMERPVCRTGQDLKENELQFYFFFLPVVTRRRRRRHRKFQVTYFQCPLLFNPKSIKERSSVKYLESRSRGKHDRGYAAWFGGRYLNARAHCQCPTTQQMFLTTKKKKTSAPILFFAGEMPIPAEPQQLQRPS